MFFKKKPENAHKVQLLVQAPMHTKEVLQALRDWEPFEGLKFTLIRRKSFMLFFEVGTASGYEARGLALNRLKEKGLAETPKLEIEIVDI